MASSTDKPNESKQDTTFTEILTTNPIPTSTKRDKAVEFLVAADSGNVDFDAEEEARVLRRIDYRVLPLILGAYFFQQLDKSSLSYVSIFGLAEDANLHGKQYSWLGSILYFAQLAMQPLVAFLLVKLPTGKLLGGAVIAWGISETLMAACSNFGSLAALRYLLGSFEAFIAPLCVVITQMWWRRREQTLRNSFWNAMNGLTAIVGSLLTYGLGHIHNDSLHRYQIIFMFCGLITVAYGVLVLWLMPDSPMEAKYLSQREKIIATRRLRANQQGIASREWKWDHVIETATDVKTYLWFLIIVSISIPSGGISTFGSLIVKDFGYSSFTAILFNIPFGAIQVLVIIGSAALANKWKRKGLVISLFATLPTAGTIILLTVPREQKGVLLFGYYLVSCLASITPLIYTWHVQNTAGDTKRKCTSAVMFCGMCTGNIVGPQLYSQDQAPQYRSGLLSNLVLFVFTGVLGAVITFYLSILNARHARQREALGKSAAQVDDSMITKEERAGRKEIDMEDQGTQQSIVLDKGWGDVTDVLNEDFIYVY